MKKIKLFIALILMLSLTFLFFRCSTDNPQIITDEDDPVNVEDTTIPVITLTGDSTVNIEVGTTYTDDGSTASDNYDGDITSNIVIVNPVDTDTVGTYTVTFNVTDTNGNNAVEVTRTVVVNQCDGLTLPEFVEVL